MPVTLTAVAQVAGVSTATASRVLSSSDYPVRAETRSRVLHAADQLGYRPNLIARSLRTEQTFTLGVVLENVSETLSTSILRGILDRLLTTAYSAIILNTDYHSDVENEAVQELVRRAAAGVIFVDTAKHSVDEVLSHDHVPSIYVNRRYRRNEVGHCVVPDNRFNGYLATEHLIKMGHRRIAHITGPEAWEATRERCTGYQQALADHGLPVDPALIMPGDWQLPSGYRAAQMLMQRDDQPTAVFASSDRMALGAVYGFQDAGLRVPHDVAVVGHDDREIAKLVRPALTTVRMPGYEMGVRAATLLLAEIEGQSDVGCELPVPGELIIRDSCSCAGAA